MSRRFADLVADVTLDDLKDACSRLHPKDAPGLLEAAAALAQIRPAADERLALRIDAGPDYVHVGATVLASGDEVALDFSRWSTFLGLLVPDRLLAEFSPAEIAAHVLWELTFYGFSEEQSAERAKAILLQRPDGDGGGDSAASA